MKRMRTVIILGVFAAALALPTASHAGSFRATCDGLAPADGTPTTCTATWIDEQPSFVSSFETHGNLHHLIGSGSVTLRWIDPVGSIIAQMTCSALGLAAPDPRGGYIGPLDVGSFTCSNDLGNDMPDTYEAGIQTLEVTATALGCQDGPVAEESCRFHGHIEIGTSGQLF